MKASIISTAVTLLWLATLANAQPTQEWIQRYNGPGNWNDWGYSIAVDASSNAYVTGYSWSGGTWYDYVLLKYNSDGVPLWVQRYNGPANTNDVAEKVVVDDFGNAYITGYSTGLGTGRDFATVKYNSAGVQQWASRYNGAANQDDWAVSIAVDDSGNVFVTGYTEVSGTSDDYATVKYSSEGVERWARTYNGPGNGYDHAQSIAVDHSSNAYVTGYSEGSETGYDWATIKYSPAGDVLWNNRYNGPGNGADFAWSNAIDWSGNVIVTGESRGIVTDFDFATIKYNPAGDALWVERHNGPGNGHDYGDVVVTDVSDNVYVMGGSNGIGTGYDYTTIKYNSSGVPQWVQEYDGPGSALDYPQSIAVDAWGNVAVTGLSTGIGTGWDYATIEYNSAGDSLWVERYNGPGNQDDGAYSLAVDALGNVYITGWSPGSGTFMDVATIKYSSPSAAVDQTPFELTGLPPAALRAVLPNPTLGRLSYQVHLRSDARVRVSVFDTQGRLVEKLIDGRLTAGEHRFAWDPSDARNKLARGTYYLRLDAEGVHQSRKLILLK